MNVLVALVAVSGLFLIGLLGGTPSLRWGFGVVLPYLAVVVFFGGLFYRIAGWARSAVPFRIPTTCGQQRSLPWIKHSKLDNPFTTRGVIGRMALEVLCFRSLLRNTKTELIDGNRLTYATDLSLWIGALAMHWAFLVILLRHLRFFTNPVPFPIAFLEKADGFFEIGLPAMFITSAVFLIALSYLLYRRLALPQVRYISLIADYFPLFLLLAIGITGFALRHLVKADVASIKQFALGLVSLSPVVPEGVSALFFAHLFLVSVLLMYFPFSKLVHMAGVFLSPTRNLANNNRAVRHINPWDYPVKVHTYAEYEDELRDKMIGAGLPVERQ